MSNPIDLLARATPALKTFAKKQDVPIVVDSPNPLPPAVLAAAAAELNGICPGSCSPSCWEMARTVRILMPDGTERLAAMFYRCMCVDVLGNPCSAPVAVPVGP